MSLGTILWVCFLGRTTAFNFVTRCLTYSSLRYLPPEQCHGQVSSLGVGFNSNQILVGYSYNLCVTIALLCLEGNLPSKIYEFVTLLVLLPLSSDSVRYNFSTRTIVSRNKGSR